MKNHAFAIKQMHGFFMTALKKGKEVTISWHDIVNDTAWQTQVNIGKIWVYMI